MTTYLLSSLFLCLFGITGVSSFQMRLSRQNLQTSLDYSYRNMKGDDIDKVSQLCADIFEGPFNALQFIQKISAVNNFKAQLLDRYNTYVLSGAKHSMVVCVDDDASTDDDIIGFVEIGMLPRPATVNDITKKVGNKSNTKFISINV